MKHYLKGGLQGAIFGGLMASLFFLSQYLGAYTSRGDTFVLRAMKNTSEVFLIPASPFAGWGVSIVIFVIAAIVIYFLLGLLILGNYYKWREINQPTNWILKRFPFVLSLLIIVAVGFMVHNSWTEWGRWQIYLSCEKDYGPSGGGSCGGKGEQTCQEADQKDVIRIQCLKDRGYLDKSYPVGPTSPSQLGR